MRWCFAIRHRQMSTQICEILTFRFADRRLPLVEETNGLTDQRWGVVHREAHGHP